MIEDQIHNNVEDIFEYGMILNQIRKILRLYPSFLIQYGRRQVNLVAHSLAKFFCYLMLSDSSLYSTYFINGKNLILLVLKKRRN